MNVKNYITIKNLNSRVHHNLNWELKKNEVHGIIGCSGQGKSSLLNILLGIMQYESGEILNEFQQPWDLQKEVIGVQFQSSALFNNLTVGENIMMPLIATLDMPKDFAFDIAMHYLEKFSLHLDVFDKYPNECSGGMQKKIALVRALILEPKVLFLDEPTAGLDCMAIEGYDALIKSLTNITIVMVTHDLARLIKIADRISIMINGCFITDYFSNLQKSDNIEVRKFIESYVRTNSII